MAAAIEIATWLGAETRVDTTTDLTSVSSIDAATPTSVVFASDAKTLAKALESKAGLILTSASLDSTTQDLRVVKVPDARLAFSQVAGRLRRRDANTILDPTVVIHASAKLGEGTHIGARSVIEANVSIGRDCEIGPNVTIYEGTRIGNRVNVQAGAVLGSQGFGYAHDATTGRYILFPQQGTLTIEDDVDIGANTTIDRGALGETRIGEGSKLDNLVHIGHNCCIGRHVIIAAQTGISGSSVIEDGAILGGQVGIGEHALVGKGVILGGGAGVLSGKKMHGSNEVFWGRPARPLKEYLKDLARLKRK